MIERLQPSDQGDAAPIDVPLSGPGSSAWDTRTTATVSASVHRRPTGSRAAVLGALGLLAFSVLAVALVGLAQNGDGAPDRSSSVDANDATPVVTTPSTLSALERIPSPGGVLPAPPNPGSAARQGPLLGQVNVPTYPKAIGEPAPEHGDYDLVAAVSALAQDTPRTGSTHLEIGGELATDVFIVRDPTTDRYQITRGDVVTLVDASTGVTFVDRSTPDEQRWATVDQRSLAVSAGAETVGALYLQLLLGPVRLDTRAWATVTPGDLVMIDDFTVAREFAVELPGSVIPEWQLYPLGPSTEFVSVDLPTRLTYRVYVDRQNQIRRVVGISSLGATPQLVVHDLGTLAERFPIELPDPAAVEP